MCIYFPFLNIKLSVLFFIEIKLHLQSATVNLDILAGLNFGGNQKKMA